MRFSDIDRRKIGRLKDMISKQRDFLPKLVERCEEVLDQDDKLSMQSHVAFDEVNTLWLLLHYIELGDHAKLGTVLTLC